MSILVEKPAIMLFVLLFITQPLKASIGWPEWEQFKHNYLSNDGRIIDPRAGKFITTSEGQSYALFFALVANDPATFKKLLEWTTNNLAAGNLKANLPAWLWGENSAKLWGVLDANSAADADLWLAYDLLEAGRLWRNHNYTILGVQLLARIQQEQVVAIPRLGVMLLPGKTGFVQDDNWRLNPSYLPLPLLARFAAFTGPWRTLKNNTRCLLLESSPQGFAPDWIIWNKQQGWQADQINPHLGSYDAIRVYLWIGMMANSRIKKKLIKHFNPIILLTQRLGFPPEQIDTVSGATKGKGSVGFSAALLPLLEKQSALAAQRKRIATTAFPVNAYYDAVLILFGTGWDQQRYRFTFSGKLLPRWYH